MFDICGSREFRIATRNNDGFWIADSFSMQLNKLDRKVHFRFDVNLTRLRVGPFEGPANAKPPALPEVHDACWACSWIGEGESPFANLMEVKASEAQGHPPRGGV